jgi:hypothetical protein
MSTILESRLAEATQLLAACGWTIAYQQQGTRFVYVVRDPTGLPRRSFVPINRLYDYARGVFDSQVWS